MDYRHGSDVVSAPWTMEKSGNTSKFTYLKPDLQKLGHVYFLIWCIFVIIGNLMLQQTNDDKIFSALSYSFSEFTLARAQQWSSRTIVEIFIYLFIIKFPMYVFKIVNIGIALIFPFLTAHVSGGYGNGKKTLFPVLCLLLMYPIRDLGTAGWQTTIINYVWPLAAAFVSGIFLLRRLCGQPLSWTQTVLSLIFLSIAGNCEQLCLYILPIICVILIYSTPKLPLAYCFTGILIIELIYTIYIPGNASRMASETATWMPDFPFLSFFDKFFTAYNTTIIHFIFNNNYIWYSLIGILIILIFSKYTNIFYRAIAIFPLCGLLMPHFPVYSQLFTIPYEHIQQYIAFFLSLFIIAAVSISILLATEHIEEGLAILGVLGTGLATRIALGFSPTLYASDTRTFFFLYAGIICVAAWLWTRYADMLTAERRLTLNMFLCIMGISGFIDQNLRHLLS